MFWSLPFFDSTTQLLLLLVLPYHLEVLVLRFLIVLADDHVTPQFTPPELPKRVHVRGIYYCTKHKAKPETTTNPLISKWLLFSSKSIAYLLYSLAFHNRKYCCVLWFMLFYLVFTYLYKQNSRHYLLELAFETIFFSLPQKLSTRFIYFVRYSCDG